MSDSAHSPVPATVIETERRHNLARIKRVVVDLKALREAIAGPFGTDFDQGRWSAAFDSTDPASVNQVSAVVGAFERIVNGLAETARSGLLASGIETPGKSRDSTVPDDLRQVRDAGGLTDGQCSLLIALTTTRNLLQHDYIEVEADDVRDAVQRLQNNASLIVPHLNVWLTKHGVGFKAPAPSGERGRTSEK